MDEQARCLERIRQGECDALAEYLQAVRPQLLAYIGRRLGDSLRRKLEAEDIFQETSADVLRGLHAVDLSQRDVFGWLCQVAERRIVDAHRRLFAQKRDAAREVPLGGPAGETGQAGLLDLLVASFTTPSEAFSRDARQARLQVALAQLPSEHREAVRLRYVENLPSKEIAARLGKSDAAVRVILSRTLRRLQILLTSDE